MTDTNHNILSIKNLSTHFYTEQGLVKAVQDVSFDIPAGKTLAVVGESGCGKSVTALSVMRLIPWPPGKIVEGQIVFNGLRNGELLLDATEARMREIRGNDIAMIFQEPMTSLNPVFTVGNQIVEAVKLHQKKSGDEARAIAVEVMRKVGIADPQRRVDEYPHQMSGGMRQRVMIAMALCCDPKLLIADEPTTALDVTIQAQILELLRDLQKKRNMSIMLITHDLGVVAENSDDVVVMYASRIAETATAQQLFEKPLHPYTKGLLKSLPRLGEKKERLDVIGGNVPSPLSFPAGCKFHPRCPIGCNDKRCQTDEPPLKEMVAGHCVACWYAGQDIEKSKDALKHNE
ncbi:MAG: ABC transporter ATP-binding protein [Planctomycetota bacterium]|jgi:peptide/nickel transport system ATP-binding protein/oligopeptide transport system ATP-binding protein